MLSFSYADQIRIDDDILVHKNNGLSPETVINVSSMRMKGTHNYYFLFLSLWNNYVDTLYVTYSIY